MARSINSPGVQITETDLSTNVVPVVGTNIFVMGYSDQGPTDETLLITSISEFETVYGTPKTTSEQYFYHTCKEILNSPATLLTTRLPYGSGSGEGFAEQYSALIFPVLSSANASTSALSSFELGQPIHRALSNDEYSKFLQNNLSWNSLSGTTIYNNTSGAITLNAGLVILNKGQTTINENYEGYYLALTDNRNVDAGSDFTSVNKFYTITSNAGSFSQLGASRLAFTLSASNEFAGTGSVSEIIEGVPTFNFSDNYFKDSLILTLFKVRKSIYEPDLLSLTLAEAHIGSLDVNKKNLLNTTAFLEDVVNNNSNNLTVYINPSIKNTQWTQTLSSVNPDVSVVTNNDALFANGVYAPSFNAAATKETGSVTDKVKRALSNIESTETVNVDIVIDGGLSTIHSNTETKKFYNDAEYVDRSDISSSNSQAVTRWRGFFSIVDNFAKNTRKDCMFIADPLRQIFVNGINTKTMSLKGSNFTTTIYNPLKNLVTGINSNYSALYGNWIKSFDTFVDRSIWLPPSGFLAAIYARVDAAANPWIAPAGLNRGIINNVLDLAFNPNQKQRDFLYTISINPIVFFSGDGFTVFGQKTLQAKPSAFDRINVRRLFLTLEKSVLRTIKYFVFEPNTAFTRSRVVNTLSPIFENAKNTEGLYDYRIVCDERNNTPDVIDANELKVDIYIKPVRAAEFILVNFIATRTGQDFDELL